MRVGAPPTCPEREYFAHLRPFSDKMHCDSKLLPRQKEQSRGICQQGSASRLRLDNASSGLGPAQLIQSVAVRLVLCWQMP